MKKSTFDNLKITALGLASGTALLAFIGVVAHYRADWENWLGFVVWTGGIFGCLAYFNYDDLKRARCLLVFLLALALHSFLLIRYLQSTERFPAIFYLFFAPFEGGAVAAMMYLLGGAGRGRRWGCRTSHRRIGSEPGHADNTEKTRLSEAKGPQH